MKPWVMVLIFVGIAVVAAAICAVIWHFTHSGDQDDKSGDPASQFAAGATMHPDEPEATEGSGSHELSDHEDGYSQENETQNGLSGDLGQGTLGEPDESLAAGNEAEGSALDGSSSAGNESEGSASNEKESAGNGAGGNASDGSLAAGNGAESDASNENPPAGNGTEGSAANEGSPAGNGNQGSASNGGGTVGNEPDGSASNKDASAGNEAQGNGEQGNGSSGSSGQSAMNMSFSPVEDSVTPKEVVNLRSVPTTLDPANIVTQAKNGEVLSRTGVNQETGWSRLEYQGQILYAVTGNLTTDLSYTPPAPVEDPNQFTTAEGRVIIFKSCDNWVTPKEYANLRTEPSTAQGEATVSCRLEYGARAHRTGYSEDTGWSRVEYNGQVLYVVSSLVFEVEVSQEQEAN